MQIPIFQIKVADGRREASPEAVRELADSIAKVGLLNPITVDQEYTLIAGLHRLEAAKLLGWSEIECNVSSLEGLMAQLAEIDENIVRKGFSDDEYDEMLLRRKEIYETLHPETKHGGDRKSGKIKMQNLQLDSAKSFIQDTADKTGMAPRTVDMCSGSSSSQHITWLPRGNCSRRNASHSFDIVRIFCLLCSFVDHSHLYGWAVLLLLIPVLTEQILQIRRFTVLDRVVLQVLL